MDTPPHESEDILRSLRKEEDRMKKNYLGRGLNVQTATQRFGPEIAAEIAAYILETPGPSGDGEDEEDGTDDQEEFSEHEDGVETLGQAPGTDVQGNGPMYAQSDGGAGGAQASPSDDAAASHDIGSGPRHSHLLLQRERMNLTAFSQRYNLYFTAYTKRVHVYQPRSGLQILPSHCLVLRPKRSAAAKVTRGSIDPSFPHQINHLIVGELGDLEVLLFCYDDGDVVAYYTHAIARYICNAEYQQRLRGCDWSGPWPTLLTPRPFFHDSVGSSAWGLALHKKSRLLAVSCNRREVIVWAFAITKGVDDTVKVASPDESRQFSSGLSASQLEAHFQSRTRTWKIILPLSQHHGQHVPSIAFADDELGNADKVVAIDILGKTWILDLWQVGRQPIMMPGGVSRAHHFDPPSERTMGWGIVVLPEVSFMPVKTYREALGLFKEQILWPKALPRSHQRQPHVHNGERWVDTTCSIFELEQDAANPMAFMLKHATLKPYIATYRNITHKTRQEEMDEDEVSDSDMSSEPNKRVVQPVEPADVRYWGAGIKQVIGTSRDRYFEPKREIMKGYLMARAIIPAFGHVHEIPTAPHPDRDTEALTDRATRIKPVKVSNVQLPPQLKRLVMLRTMTADIELQPFDSSLPGVVCKNVIKMHNHFKRPVPYDLKPSFSERISMLHHVFELNLIVAGSLCGRVALLTLTRCRKMHPMAGRIEFGFRLDWVLPRKEEEDARLRPWAALHGMAVSPIPSPKARGLDLYADPTETVLPKRYRLVLHYMDHSILTYELGRDLDDDLQVFG